MGKLSRQHMKKAIDQHMWSQKGQEADKLITLGMYLCEIALANKAKDPWGKKRLQELEANVHALCKVELIGGAKRFTSDYGHNVDHGLIRIADRLEQIHGEGHGAWLRDFMKNY